MIVSGVVEKGAGIGKSDFVPTVNLLLEHNPTVDFGVYTCRINVESEWYNGVVHFGPRTSLDDLITFEVNIFDFDKNVYGKTVEVEVLDKLRGIIKFDSLADLKSQILKDIVMAKNLLK
jgi:riboflavin kinase / FMN adenylyltransferase